MNTPFQQSTIIPDRQHLLMDDHWRFHLGDLSAAEEAGEDPHMTTYLEAKTGFAQGAARPDYDDRSWRDVQVPHDWAVEGSFDPSNNMDHGFLPAGVGWYRRYFDIPADDLGKTVYIEFDGVFRNSTIWLNGHRLGTHLSGYTSFRYDISDVLHYGGKNVLAVRVDATDFEGWWYEGAGIYRHVWLLKTSPLHVAPWGTFVKTHLDATYHYCRLEIQTSLVNGRPTATQCDVESSVYGPDGGFVASITSTVELAADDRQQIYQIREISEPQLWSIDTPALYKLQTVIRQGDRIVDSCETVFGIRTFHFDPDTGFTLNGQPLKLKGTCNHQDHAGVGVALPDRLHEYRIERLKAMGCNAYRCSHNPPAPELLDACDRLGMLVMDETRRMDSTPEGLAQLESIILRDRNHPSIILWSLGNEEPLQKTDIGARICASMKRLVRKLDPTRPVTLAMNGDWGSPVSSVVDVQGCNYFIADYDDFHRRFPLTPIVAAENGSTVSTRGVYANDPALGYVSAYDVNHPSWAFLALDSWKAVAERPYVSGTFVWTGFDYRGEPTPYRWPCINSHFGILDTCGFPKDNYYYYQSWWSDQIVLHLLPHWNWQGQEGHPIEVWAHSNCDEVELFLNGRSLGRQRMQPNGHLTWSVIYEPGVLAAKGYKGDREVATATRQTTGPAAQIALTADRQVLHADGEDVAIITVAIQDAQGTVVPTSDNLVQFTISPNARILGVGNGDPSCHEPDKAAQRSVFHGLCQLIVQTSQEAGTIVVSASSKGLQSAEYTITAVPAAARPSVP